MNDFQKKSNAKIGIFLAALLMMGVIGVSSSLSVIAAEYQMEVVDVVAGLISVSCLVVIPITILSGVLMSYIAKKNLLILGIICFLIGGVCPAFVSSFSSIIAFRVLFGIGLGLVQTTCAALVAENYEGDERNKTMGWMNSFQMLGCIVMSIVGGQLGATANGAVNVYYVHLIAIISLIGAIVFVPYKKPDRTVEANVQKEKIKITGSLISWVLLFFIFMLAGQTFSNNASSLIANLGIGTPAEAGWTLAIFAAGGFVMGFMFGRIFKILKHITMSIGFLILAVSYLIMAFGTNMSIQYIGAFICGLAFSICMPLFFTSAANSVNAATSAFAISIATCLQNLGMTVSPYVVNPISKAITVRGGALIQDQNALIFGAILIGVIGIVFLIKGIALNLCEQKALNMG